MLYTGKGDKGTTKLFDSPSGVRVSKSDILFDALGTVDELNSFLGLCKIKSQGLLGDIKLEIELNKINLPKIVHDVQNNLFVIQAELAGAGKSIEQKNIEEIETVINNIESELPPITTFFVSGGTECAALFDTARAVSRRAERLVIKVADDFTKNSIAQLSTETRHNSEIKRTIQPETLQYLNRLSSLLYACARYVNHISDVSDVPPVY
ncbi:MAG: cob(I)yrinic acid a,c-diamide adenosyltransferase [Minisyncoccia bacterium]